MKEKSFAIVSVLFLGWLVSVEAAPNVMAQVSFHHYDMFQQEAAYTVQLLNNRTIQVTEMGVAEWYDGAIDYNEANLMVQMAEGLGKLNETSLAVGSYNRICRVPPPVISSDLYIITDYGKANMILSDDGCWRGLSVQPADKDLKGLAQYLREQMITHGKRSLE